MYEEIIDWGVISEIIGVIPAVLFKIGFIWGMPVLILFSSYLIYWLVVNQNYIKFTKRRIELWKNI